MITNHIAEFEKKFRSLRVSRPSIPKAVFMVGADAFGISPHAAKDNSYIDLDDSADITVASRQARTVAQKMAQLGVPVIQFPGLQGMPDAVFPNNVFAPIESRLLVGSMRHPDRKLEAQRQDIRDFFANVCGMDVRDMREDGVAELTGVYVIDRGRGAGFCGMTDRVSPSGLQWMHNEFDSELSFHFDLRATEYHTNVIMSILASRALVINPDAFVDSNSAEAVIRCYGDRVIELSDDETTGFAGNCIAVTERDVMMSLQGYESLSERNRRRFAELDFAIHAIDVCEIEKAGGSVRCMIGEVF